MSNSKCLRSLRQWRHWRFALLIAVAATAVSRAATVEGSVSIRRGKGEFTFVDKRGDPRKPVPVFSYVPAEADASKAPILFVMHGHHRSAEKYRNNWAKHAEKYGFMVFAPLFSEEQWGHGQYTRGVVDKNGRVRNPSLWSFNVIEHLFDAIKTATGNEQPRYLLFGFSEGGQFVHRMVLMLPEARYSKAILGSPGWYTMPRFDIDFPYGLRGAPVNRTSIRTSLGRDVVVLLGEEDNDPNHEELKKSRQAMAQGRHRLERGKKFYREAQLQAAELKTPFGWKLRIVPGAEHRPSQVTGQAAALFMKK